MSSPAYDHEDDHGRGQRIHNRKFIPCEAIAHLPVEDLITYCNDCGRYYVLCCSDAHDYWDTGRACHQYKLVFTDGACLNNGRGGARAGIGGIAGLPLLDQAYEDDPPMSWSVPVDDSVDTNPDARRSSQRAELLAAIEGLKRVEELERAGDEPGALVRLPRRHGERRERNLWILATDSEYVAKGMTEWFPTWESNNWRTAAGKRPSNLDLFLKLDEVIKGVERRRAVQVGFWRIPREHNREADGLAGAAARRALPSEAPVEV
ncbi:ribonuclease H-like protein [Trametopsis cervina]|nr:ribonuclease H-like protein [Trametopsis cervina]